MSFSLDTLLPQNGREGAKTPLPPFLSFSFELPSFPALQRHPTPPHPLLPFASPCRLLGMDLSLLDLSDPDFTLRLPSELLTLIADHLPVPPTLCSHLSKGVLQGTFETQKLGMAAAPSLRLFGSSPSASPPNSASKELGAMRLVCKRWEVATRSVLFSRGRVKRVEELEFWCGEGARKGLSGCVQ